MDNEIVEFFRELRDEVIKLFKNMWNDVKSLFNKKEQPKNVSNVHEYLEKKRKSEPFYKSVNGNKKPWE